MPDHRASGTEPTLTPDQASDTLPTSAPPGSSAAAVTSGVLPARYVVGQQLGAGGMGEVLLARDTQIDRDVAIKRMRTSVTPDALARFTREARIQGRLDHPAIVPVHELATDSDGRPFFVMKRLAGTTLEAIIARDRADTSAWPRQRRLRMFADVCLAIEFAHSRRVVHRDLKPANVMLGDFGEVYVLDWGIARVLDEPDPDRSVDAVSRDRPAAEDAGHTEVGAIFGTPGYIAPELLRGEAVDQRADVFALGCILFELLAGEPLLPRGPEALAATLEELDARPSARCPDAGIPPELDRLCVEATDRLPANRPTARGLAERIERYLDGDRDAALRLSLAAAHVEAARTAIAAGDAPPERARAIREAGAAIALDPRNQDATSMIARFMLEPPTQVPAEVEDRVAAYARQSRHAKVSTVLRAELCFLLLIPMCLLIGVRDMALFGITVVAMLVALGSAFQYQRVHHLGSLRPLYACALAHGVFYAILAHAFSPFLVVPAIVSTGLIVFAMDPRIHWRPMAAGHVAVIIVPWLLELLGVLPKTMSAVGGDLVVHIGLVTTRMPATGIMMALFAGVVIVLSGSMARSAAVAQVAAVRSIELQAWVLRRLVN